jgi:hypothetical protein
MDSTSTMQVVSGVLFALALSILIQRRRIMVRQPRQAHTGLGQDSRF